MMPKEMETTSTERLESVHSTMVRMSDGTELAATYGEIAYACAVSERTVQRVVRILARIGAVERVTGKGRGCKNRYRFQDFEICYLLGDAPPKKPRVRRH